MLSTYSTHHKNNNIRQITEEDECSENKTHDNIDSKNSDIQFRDNATDNTDNKDRFAPIKYVDVNMEESDIPSMKLYRSSMTKLTKDELLSPEHKKEQMNSS